jgi:RNA polymerase sigma factor (sigma-70 family)
MADTRSLINRILAGDRNAFRSIIEEHQRLVSHIVFRMVYNQKDREDLCQEIFVKVYTNLSSFHFGAKLSSWIAKIAYNACLDFLGKNKKILYNTVTLENTAQKNLMAGDFPPDESVERFEIFYLLQKEIEKLPVHFRTILTLYHLEEMSYAEISKIMQLPEGTVKSYLFRARRVLRGKLIRKYQKEGLWN